MKRGLGKLILGGALLGVTWLQSTPSQAHGTHSCTGSSCCSPHGATGSTQGSVFTGCGYNGTHYLRFFYCPVYSACAVELCGPAYGSAEGDSDVVNATNHNLQVYLSTCNY